MVFSHEPWGEYSLRFRTSEFADYQYGFDTIDRWQRTAFDLALVLVVTSYVVTTGARVFKELKVSISQWAKSVTQRQLLSRDKLSYWIAVDVLVFLAQGLWVALLVAKVWLLMALAETV